MARFRRRKKAKDFQVPFTQSGKMLSPMRSKGAYKTSIDGILNTSQLFITLSTNDCYWMHKSTRGLAMVNGCPCVVDGDRTIYDFEGLDEYTTEYPPP